MLNNEYYVVGAYRPHRNVQDVVDIQVMMQGIDVVLAEPELSENGRRKLQQWRKTWSRIKYEFENNQYGKAKVGGNRPAMVQARKVAKAAESQQVRQKMQTPKGKSK